MKLTLAFTLLASGLALTATAPVSARNYDCSKAGNANKAVCATTTAAPKTSTTTTAKTKTMPTGTMVSRSVTTTKTVATKPVAAVATKPASTSWFGGKTATTPARAVAARPAPPRSAAAANGNSVAWTTKTGKVVHYNCAKSGNVNKQACK